MSGPDVASSQPRGNEQCLLRGAQNTESVECAGQSGRRKLRFHFSVNLGGNPVGTGDGEERKCHVGLGAGHGFELALL